MFKPLLLPQVRIPYITLPVLFALLLVGCGGGSGSAGFPVSSIPPVEVVESRLGSLPLEQRLNGVVQARNQVTIYPEISGRLEAIFVDNGDYVQQGEALARINPRQFEEQVRQAEAGLRVQEAAVLQRRAELRTLEADLARVEQLAARDFTSASELERQRATVDGARASLRHAEALVEQAESSIEEREEALRRTVVRSPVSGRVGRRDAEVGMQVSAASSIFIVGDLTEMQVLVTLTEDMLNYIETGQRVQIHSDRLGASGVQAVVSRISPFLREGSFTTEGRIDVSNSSGLLTPGMYVDVDVFYGETDEATLIPTAALYEDGRTGRLGVFVAAAYSPEPVGSEEVILEPAGEAVGPGAGLSDPTDIVFREVDVIARGRESVGVSGIAPGEWVVVVGHDLIDADLSEPVPARVRSLPWERIVRLQEMQQQDLLRQFMDKQQQMARLQMETGQSDS